MTHYKDLEKLRKDANGHTLNDSERTHMREEFVSFLALHTPAGLSVPKSHSKPSFQRHLLQGSVLVLVLLTTTFYLSEDALPHEPLYIVKTSLTEPALELTFSFSPHTSAQVDTFIVERRLEEAVELLYHDTLTDEVAQDLTLAITTHTEMVTSELTNRPAETLSESLTIAQTLEQTLDTHAEVFEILSNTKPSARSVAHHVDTARAHAQELSNEIAQTMLENTTVDVVPEDVSALHDEIVDTLSSLTVHTESEKGNGDLLLQTFEDTHATTYTEAAADLVEAHNLLLEGKHEDAFITLTETQADLSEHDSVRHHLNEILAE